MKIFVSYRRDDTGHVARRLSDALEDAFGPDSVFYDEVSIAVGGDFLGSAIGGIYVAGVILVLIGDSWATAIDTRGRQRLRDKDDPVAWEVGMALASGRPVVPLLVDGAAMPAKRDLPRNVRDITTRSGLRLDSGAGFEASMRQLIQSLGGPVSTTTGPAFGTRRPQRTAAPTSFEGKWQTQDGTINQVIQDGNIVELAGTAVNGISYRASGNAQGGSAILDFVSSAGVRGQLILELVENGNYINGKLQTPQGIMPFQMMRRSW